MGSSAPENPPAPGQMWEARSPLPPRGKFHGSSPDGPAILYGIHAVKAALENPARRIRRLLTTENALRRLREDSAPIPLEPEMVRPEALAARLGPEAVHQGVLAEADPLPSPEIEDIPAGGIVLVLDQITDPHNVGAIFRSAAAFAVSAIVTTARHSPGSNRGAGQIGLRRARTGAAGDGTKSVARPRGT